MLRIIFICKKTIIFRNT